MHFDWTKQFKANRNHQLWIIFNFWVWLNIGKEMDTRKEILLSPQGIGLDVVGNYISWLNTLTLWRLFYLSSLFDVAEMVRRQALFPGDSEFQQLLHIFRYVHDQSQSSLYFCACHFYVGLVGKRCYQQFLLFIFSFCFV